MSRVYTAADIEELARDGATQLVLAAGELISPAAVDLASARGVALRRPGDPVVDDGPPSADDAHGDCSCHAEEALESSVRAVVQAAAAANPGADARTVAAEALKALGAAGGPGVGSVHQAEPREGRLLPAKAKGAKPTFFDDGGATDAVIGVVTALASEVWALRERIDSLERVLTAKGALARGAVEGFRPDAAAADERAQDAADYVSRVFRVFEQMREEIAADETVDDYMEVVRRAFAEI